MEMFRFEELELKGAYIISSFFSEDNRGSFVKCYEEGIFKEAGIPFSCSEDFISRSSQNVIRGMHFQTNNPQAKIVGVISGKVYDVILDLRESSETYGQWRGFYLSSENRSSLYIPRGFAHGFISLSENSIVSYKCDGAYDAKSDTGIKFNDPDIRIDWPIWNSEQAIVSSRDRNLMSFKVFKEKFGGI